MNASENKGEAKTAVIYRGPVSPQFDGSTVFSIRGGPDLPKGVPVVVESKKELAELKQVFEANSRYHLFEIDDDYHEPVPPSPADKYAILLKDDLIDDAVSRHLDLPSDATKDEVIEALVADDSGEPDGEEPAITFGDDQPSGDSDQDG